MPNIDTRQLAVYTTDLGTAVPNLRFKIRADYGPVIPGYDPAPNSACGAGGGLFTPRAIKVDFDDGSSIRFPVANPSNIALFIQQLRTNLPGFACAHLEGERWRFIPPAAVGAPGGNNTGYDIPAGVTDVRVGSADYTSDLIGPTNIRYRFEGNPVPIAAEVFNCLANPVQGTQPCSPSAGIQPRELTVEAINNNGGSIVRKTKPQDWGGDVVACAARLYGVGLCVRYRGESARNVHLLV
jgi:hypothetical protein